MDTIFIKQQIKNKYSNVAKEGRPSSFLSWICKEEYQPKEISRKVGYTPQDLKTISENDNLALGCGNPTALASIKDGETILDLGSGAGFDAFLTARRVGSKGNVIGIDISEEMVEKAKHIARKNHFTNTKFIVGDIEKLPLPGASVDMITSNCVIHLSTNTRKVFKEAFRVLKSGGRLMISDLALTKELPFMTSNIVSLFAHYIPEMKLREKYLQDMKEAGFQNIKILHETPFPIDAWLANPTLKCLFNKYAPKRCKEVAQRVVSIKISATKMVN